MADIWNTAYYFNELGIRFPGCVLIDIAYDFDITTIQYSKKTKTVNANSKSSYKWSFTQNLTYGWAKLLVDGGLIGGYSWQGALRDENNFDHIFAYGASTNCNLKQFTLPNGTNITTDSGLDIMKI
jgi:hypothetical protein